VSKGKKGRAVKGVTLMSGEGSKSLQSNLKSTEYDDRYGLVPIDTCTLTHTHTHTHTQTCPCRCAALAGGCSSCPVRFPEGWSHDLGHPGNAERPSGPSALPPPAHGCSQSCYGLQLHTNKHTHTHTLRLLQISFVFLLSLKIFPHRQTNISMKLSPYASLLASRIRMPVNTFEGEVLQDVEQQESGQPLAVRRRLPQTHTLNTQWSHIPSADHV